MLNPAALGGLMGGGQIVRPLPHDLMLAGVGASALSSLPTPDLSRYQRLQASAHRLGQRLGLGALGHPLLRFLYRRALREVPGAHKALYTSGDCIAPVLNEGDIALLDRRSIRPGDVALIDAVGCPTPLGKVFLGVSGRDSRSKKLFGDHPGPFADFHCWCPQRLILVPVDELTQAQRVAAVYRGGKVLPLDQEAVRAKMRDLSGLSFAGTELAPV